MEEAERERGEANEAVGGGLYLCMWMIGCGARGCGDWGSGGERAAGSVIGSCLR